VFDHISDSYYHVAIVFHHISIYIQTHRQNISNTLTMHINVYYTFEYYKIRDRINLRKDTVIIHQ